jgi:hydrogenase expression/formation protein HypC
MCLATPARIEQRTGDDAWVSLGATRVRVNLAMTPEAGVGDWVLVHAGFAIEHLDETSVRLIWESLGEFQAAQAAEEERVP